MSHDSLNYGEGKKSMQMLLDYKGTAQGLLAFLEEVRNCKYCDGRGIYYVPNGEDDVSPEVCEHYA